MATTDELIYSVSLDFDKIGFKSLEASLDKTIKAFAVATAAAAAASAVIFKMGSGFANTTDNLIKTSERVDATTSEIQKLTFAAEDNGATMDDVTSSLANLSRQQEELLRGKGDFEAWGQLNVNPDEYSNTSDLLMAISDSVKDLNSQEATDLMSRVGISPQLLQTMQLGSEGLKSLGNEFEALGGVSTPKMLKASQDFMSGWQRASSTVTGILNKVSTNLLDETINPAIEAFNKFAKNNMQKIAEIMTKIFDGIAKASEFIFSTLNRLAQPFAKLINMFSSLEEASMTLAVAIGIIKAKTIAAMLPAILIVGGLYLAFDELMSFLSGEESFIGDFFDSIGLGANNVRDTLKEFGNPLTRFIELLQLSYEGWTNLYDWIMLGIEKLLAVFEKLGNIIDNVLDFEMPSIRDIAEGAGGLLDSSIEGAKNLFGFGGGETPAPQTNNNNINIQVDGSKDPVAVGEEVKRVLNEEMNKSAMRAGY